MCSSEKIIVINEGWFIGMSTVKDTHPTMQRLYLATGLNPADIALKLNESPQTINNWDKRGISKNGALKACTKFNIDFGWLMSGNGEQHIESINKNETSKKKPMGHWVPVKSFSKMGDDGYFTDMGYEGNAGDGYVPSLTASDKAYAVRGTGDSMYPAIRSGWYIICDPDSPPIPTEFVEVELKDGRRTIKEFIGVVNDVLHLLAVNGDKRMTFDMDTVENIIAVTDIVPPSRHVNDYPYMEIKSHNFE